MPATLAAYQLTDAYRAQQRQVRDMAARGVVAAWQQITPADFDGGFARFHPVATGIVTQAQRLNAAVSAHYLSGYVNAETGATDTPTAALDPSDYAHTDAGIPWSVAWTSGLVAAKLAVLQGADPEAALRLGQVPVLRIAASEPLNAGRSALRDAMGQTDRVIGWRRVSGGGCWACDVAATGAIHRDDTVPPVHPSCACTAEPVVRGVDDSRYSRQTPDVPAGAMDASEEDKNLGGNDGE